MYLPLLLLCVLLVLFPRANVHAILPPDLVVSVSQSILGIFGLIIASVTLTLVSIRNTLFMFLPTTLHKVLFFLILCGLVIVLLAAVFFLEEEKQLAQWQSETDVELRNIWSQYSEIYSAPDERSAQDVLTGSAQKVTWAEFQQIVKDEEYLIVDIRDIHAYQSGHLEGSLHMRWADLVRGRWKELRSYKDTPILIVCFFGTTGTITSNFLAAQGFSKLYVPDGGLLTLNKQETIPLLGTIKFKYHAQMIDRLSNTEIIDLKKEDAIIIDVRSPESYNDDTVVAPDIYFFREFKTLPEIQTFLDSLEPDRSYVSLCNSDLSCFQGEMLLHDLKTAGLTAGGTYDSSKPEGIKW